MARYIDADALKRKAQKTATEAWKMKLIAKVETTLNQFIDWIDEMPTVQPKIIRCKDCKWFDYDWHQCRRQVCASFYMNDYCSYAEREEDD